MPFSSDFVRHCYLVVLRRQPTDAEARMWADSQRDEEGMVRALLSQATEVRAIARLYAGLLGRLPDGLDQPASDADGLTYWTGVLRTLRTEGQGRSFREALILTIRDWFDTPDLQERLSLAADDRDRVCVLSQGLLGRTPDPDQLDEWSALYGRLPEGRQIVAATLSETDECKDRFNPAIDAQLRHSALAGSLS